MKTMKKLFCTLLAVVMLLAMAGVAMADDTTTTTTTTTVPPVPTGTIEITGLANGESIKIYQVIEFESEGTASLSDAKWVSIIQNWITSNSPKYDEYKDAANLPAKPTVSEATFYNALSGQMKNLTAVVNDTANGATYTTKALPVGSYMVLIMGGEYAHQPYLASIKPTGYNYEGNEWIVENGKVKADDKVSKPNVDKKVFGDKKDGTVAIGQEVPFTITSDVPTYPESAYDVTYKLADIMDEGLTFDDKTLKVYGVDANNSETELTGSNAYTAAYPNSQEANNKVKIFELTFDYAKIKDYKQIKVTYTATVNDKIKVQSVENTNEVKFTYDNTTLSDSTVVYSFGFDLTKYAETASGALLAGAEFELTTENGTKLTFTEKGDGHYVLDPKSTNTKLVTGKNDPMKGKIIVDGLGVGKYKLEETKAPSGYNRMTEKKDVTIAQNGDAAKKQYLNSTNDETKFESAYWYEKIVDKKISGLPVTGGMGTTIFMVAGIAVMACAVAALLVVLKRQKHSEG
mgnify:FL=1